MTKIPVMKKLARIRSLATLWKHRSQLYSMFRESFRGSYKMMFLTKVVLLLGTLYILFPIDIIPDFIPVIGWMDDGAIFYLLLRQIMSELNRYNTSRSTLNLIHVK
jgi:uncharacterized membrane protein YkvA (DUF1232 family)